MNFQYYDTLRDKSEKNLFSLIESIRPEFTKTEFEAFVNDIDEKTLLKSNSVKSPYEGFRAIGEDFDTTADLSALNSKQLEIIYKYFISRELSDPRAIKWRFYQYLKYIPNLDYDEVLVDRSNNKDQKVSIVLTDEDRGPTLIMCYDKLDEEIYLGAINYLKEFQKERKIDPYKVIIAVAKTYRNISIDKEIELSGDVKVKPELWVEWIDPKSTFNGEDLIIVNNHEIELAGFNFTNLQDLLDYVYLFSEGGQISIYRQRAYYSEIAGSEVQDVELIWKGIMLKEDFE